MPRRIALIQGHPTPGGGHFGHALAQAYSKGAAGAGHELRLITVAELDFPLLRSKREWDQGPVPPSLIPAQEAIAWADHLVLIYPLWLGTLPASFKGFLEQVLRPGFAIDAEGSTRFAKRLSGKSARVVVTMGMPAFIYRWYFGAHGLKSLERNILRFCGIARIRETLIGGVEAIGDGKRRAWLERLEALGRAGA